MENTVCLDKNVLDFDDYPIFIDNLQKDTFCLILIMDHIKKTGD